MIKGRSFVISVSDNMPYSRPLYTSVWAQQHLVLRPNRANARRMQCNFRPLTTHRRYRTVKLPALPLGSVRALAPLPIRGHGSPSSTSGALRKAGIVWFRYVGGCKARCRLSVGPSVRRSVGPSFSLSCGCSPGMTSVCTTTKRCRKQTQSVPASCPSSALTPESTTPWRRRRR